MVDNVPTPLVSSHFVIPVSAFLLFDEGSDSAIHMSVIRLAVLHELPCRWLSMLMGESICMAESEPSTKRRGRDDDQLAHSVDQLTIIPPSLALEARMALYVCC